MIEKDNIKEVQKSEDKIITKAKTTKPEANNTEKKELDLTKYKVESIINVTPLEPAIVWAAISDESNEELSYKSVGIPGFYDIQNKKFISLDGGKITVKEFNEKLNIYVEQMNKVPENNSENQITDNEIQSIPGVQISQ